MDLFDFHWFTVEYCPNYKVHYVQKKSIKIGPETKEELYIGAICSEAKPREPTFADTVIEYTP